MPTNRQITLAARPEGFPQESDFALVEEPVAEPGAGEVLVRSRWLSLDPYMRGRMSTTRSYAKATELGEVMTGQVVGEVVASEDARFAPGDHVVGQLGWQDYAVARGGTLRKIDTQLAPPQAYLHVLGTTGLTAYFGLFDILQPKPGDTVVVSGAAGAVGQVVGQLAKIAGCRAVGIAGGPEKVAELVDVYGYDAGIDYKADDVNAALKEHCPHGVDAYFDNVGGTISETVFRRLTVGARIAICGQISQYNLAEPELAPRNLGFLIVFRARMEGFLVSDYVHRFGEALERLGRWLADGRIVYREDVTEGLENAPGAFIGMLNGREPRQDARQALERLRADHLGPPARSREAGLRARDSGAPLPQREHRSEREQQRGERRAGADANAIPVEAAGHRLDRLRQRAHTAGLGLVVGPRRRRCAVDQRRADRGIERELVG